jgi:hypothetical protein
MAYAWRYYIQSAIKELSASFQSFQVTHNHIYKTKPNLRLRSYVHSCTIYLLRARTKQRQGVNPGKFQKLPMLKLKLRYAIGLLHTVQGVYIVSKLPS